MSFIGCARNSRLEFAARRVAFDASSFLSANVRNVVRLSTIALTTAVLTGCAQSSVVGNKSALHVAGRPTTLAAIGIGKHNLLARGKHAAEKYGVASFYTEGTETANGEKIDPQALTAAHRTLPFGTMLRVTNLETGRTVTVRVNDRGPFVQGRNVDLSYSAAESLGIVDQGVAKVRLDVLH
jgi:rare lipoprotein A